MRESQILELMQSQANVATRGLAFQFFNSALLGSHKPEYMKEFILNSLYDLGASYTELNVFEMSNLALLSLPDKLQEIKESQKILVLYGIQRLYLYTNSHMSARDSIRNYIRHNHPIICLFKTPVPELGFDLFNIAQFSFISREWRPI